MHKGKRAYVTFPSPLERGVLLSQSTDRELKHRKSLEIDRILNQASDSQTYVSARAPWTA